MLVCAYSEDRLGSSLNVFLQSTIRRIAFFDATAGYKVESRVRKADA